MLVIKELFGERPSSLGLGSAASQARLPDG
jgi:hypothetical protein